MNYSFESNDEIEKIIKNCKSPEKAISIFESSWEIAERECLKITGYKWQSLANHISAMIDRSCTNEMLEGFDIGMFSEISESSLKISAEIVNLIGNLSEVEKYLLSVHFETAKME